MENTIAAQDVDDMELMTLRPGIAAKLRAAEAAPDPDCLRRYLDRIAHEVVILAARDAQCTAPLGMDRDSVDPLEAERWIKTTGAAWCDTLVNLSPSVVRQRADTWYHQRAARNRIGG